MADQGRLFDNQILKYIDNHLVLKFMDFVLETDKSNTQNLLTTKKEILFKTYLFEEQENFLNKHKDLNQGENEKIVEKRSALLKLEQELKSSIENFLSLTENFRRGGSVDPTFSVHKKIVIIINLDRRNSF
jgi:hypothetical protein